MAELAELESALGNYQEASVWAYLYDHYSTAKGWSNRSGYFPELLSRTYDRVDAATWKKVVAEGNGFIQQNDALIKAAWALGHQSSEKLWVKRPGGFSLRATGSYPVSIIAQFLATYDKTGSPVDTWLLGAVPNAKAAAILQDKATFGRIVPIQDGNSGLRNIQVIIHYDDHRYETTSASHN